MNIEVQSNCVLPSLVMVSPQQGPRPDQSHPGRGDSVQPVSIFWMFKKNEEQFLGEVKKCKNASQPFSFEKSHFTIFTRH